MKIFSCSQCDQLVFFENVRCTSCDATLAFLPDLAVVSALEPDGEVFKALVPGAKGKRYRLCQNSLDHGVCNWAVPVEDHAKLCRSCRLNEVIPDLSQPGALLAWGRIEQAKRRLLFTLFQLGLPVESAHERDGGLVFSFKASDPVGQEPVFTGHDHGRITLNIAEADNPGRERLREQLGETYRTLLGHFRHEIGHYYWDVLVRDTDELPRFRKVFGDHERSYKRKHEQEAVAREPARSGLAIDVEVDRADPFTGFLHRCADPHGVRAGLWESHDRLGNRRPTAVISGDGSTVPVIDGNHSNLVVHPEGVDRFLGGDRVVEVEWGGLRSGEDVDQSLHLFETVPAVADIIFEDDGDPGEQDQDRGPENGDRRGPPFSPDDLPHRCFTPIASASNRELIAILSKEASASSM